MRGPVRVAIEEMNKYERADAETTMRDPAPHQGCFCYSLSVSSFSPSGLPSCACCDGCGGAPANIWPGANEPLS